MPELHLKNINKHYGNLHVVKGVSLDVPAGEFVVLVGPSGCGKSTLLRAVAGLEEISDGSISLGGREIGHLAPRDRNIAMVFQSYALYPYLTVYENIAFGLRARKFSEDHIDRQVKWAAEVLDIGPYLERFPRELSGGQRQRVAIGRAIVRDADLYLFDEPLSNLDAKLRDGMREEIKKLHGALGKTFIYVTHDQIEAMTLAERIVLLRDGVIEQAGAPLDLFERPDNSYVAGFLGSPPMNFIEVTVDGDGDALVLTDGTKVPFDGSHCVSRPEPGRKCRLGVRPEHFRFGETGDLNVEVAVLQPTGSRSYATFYVSGCHCVVELDAHAVTRVGEKLSLSIAMERTLLMDADTGKTISFGSGGKGAP
jgi:multiple sugar transport system ATP-binding protein